MRLTGAIALTAASVALPALAHPPADDHVMASMIKRAAATETPKVNKATLNAVFDDNGAHLAMKIMAG